MKKIGIDQNNYLVYEGDGNQGYGVWPTPTLLPAYIVSIKSEGVEIPERVDLQSVPYIFWDESYDPISRIRKGRIFENDKNQPQCWKISRHPALNNAVNDMGNSLLTYKEFNFFSKLDSEKIIDPCVIMGTSNHFTIWTVVDAEGSISGEVVLYLKSRKVIGALPKINYSLISDSKRRDQVQEKLELLYQDLKSAVPDSVVDRCREAISAAGNAYLIENEYVQETSDLGRVATNLSNCAKLHIAGNQASTLAKLHSRTKHSEQSSRGTRSVSEQDAEFAVHSLGLILVELGYGYW